MIHLIVESAFGMTQGFWGRVDAGADPGVIATRANRIGGRNKYAAYGDDLSGLVLAEVLANPGWLVNDISAEGLHGQILASCSQANLSPPLLLSPERTAEVRAILRQLARQWKGLNPRGTIQLVFDPLNPVQCFEQLLRKRRHHAEADR
jgi:hypothetical protein